MKFHSFITDLIIFLLILCALIAPVYISLAMPVQPFIQWTFPFSQLTCALGALFVFLFYRDKNDTQTDSKNVTLFMLRKLFPGLFTLCFLFFTALVLKGLTFMIQNKFWIGNQEVVLPDSFISYLFCILGFVFAAFYEEVIYRFYLPEILKGLVFKKVPAKPAIIISEILALLIFSSAHIYLGGFAVVNAIVGHCVLRICLLKSKSVWPGFIAHFVYNLLVLFLL